MKTAASSASIAAPRTLAIGIALLRVLVPGLGEEAYFVASILAGLIRERNALQPDRCPGADRRWNEPTAFLSFIISPSIG
jgi:hypothetical protein